MFAIVIGMKTIILEGIATSGKSTIINKVEDAVKEVALLKVVPEEQSLMAILDNTDLKVSLEYLNRLLSEVYGKEYSLVIFDRLHLTHAFRTNSNIEDYANIEEQLLTHSSEIIFLKVQESAIADRVKQASEHRDPSWKEYLVTKGKDFDEIAGYYIKQQKRQIELLEQSRIPYRIFDMTEHDYASILEYILPV
jgi:thymidylate kinase